MRNPEQVLFFAPFLLTISLLGAEMSKGLLTVSWSVFGVVTFLFALLVKERSFRLAGIGLLLAGVGKIHGGRRLEPRRPRPLSHVYLHGHCTTRRFLLVHQVSGGHPAIPMKQTLAFILVVALALAAIGYSEYKKADVAVSGASIFHIIGDTEQELTRLPVSSLVFRMMKRFASAIAWQTIIARRLSAR